MRKTQGFLAAVLIVCGLGAASNIPTAKAAGPTERYLHVRVQDSKEGESVSVNVPLSMAQAILPTVNKGKLHNGVVKIDNAEMNDIDVKALLEAIKNAPDNEFVSVKQKDEDVRVAKQGGNLVVHVIQKDKDAEKVDITVPMKLVDALLSNVKDNEVDVAAALKALSDAGSDALLVTVQSATEHVRIWVDSNGNPAE
jgi:hypothetical protein